MHLSDPTLLHRQATRRMDEAERAAAEHGMVRAARDGGPHPGRRRRRRGDGSGRWWRRRRGGDNVTLAA